MNDPSPIASSNEVTPVDYWHWRAHLDNGSIFDQFDSDGQAHSWLEVDDSIVNTIELVPQSPDKQTLLFEIPAGCRARVERRRSLVLSGADGMITAHGTLTVLRWTHSDGASMWVFVRDDGTVIVTHRDPSLS